MKLFRASVFTFALLAASVSTAQGNKGYACMISCNMEQRQANMRSCQITQQANSAVAIPDYQVVTRCYNDSSNICGSPCLLATVVIETTVIKTKN